VPATIGIVGLGYWGPNLLRNFAASPGWTVKYGCDLSATHRDKMRAQYPSVTYTAELAEVLDDPAVDAVAIATPVSTHHAIARAALERGKHVLVEKPLTGTVADADDLIAVAERQRRHLLVDHTFVYTGAVRKIRELAASGDLGDIYYFESSRINLGLIQKTRACSGISPFTICRFSARSATSRPSRRFTRRAATTLRACRDRSPACVVCQRLSGPHSRELALAGEAASDDHRRHTQNGGLRRSAALRESAYLRQRRAGWRAWRRP
jgi:hypothetical protein